MSRLSDHYRDEQKYYGIYMAPGGMKDVLIADCTYREPDGCDSVKPGTALRCMRQTGHHEPHQNTTVSAVESEWP